MCGIAGVLGGPRVETDTVLRMTRALAHRGPDDEGVWVDAEAGLGLGHRRLSIIDLSAAGHQPMLSPSGRYVLSFNGEIYNFADLRADIESQGRQVEWRGHSDTEVLLAGFEYWGIEPTLRRASGMFALGLWDRQDRTLTLARDRLGEKPLYYGRQDWPGAPFLFGSELKALVCYPGFRREVDREALDLFVRNLAVPAPYSIYRGVSKLPAGTYLTVREGEEPTVRAYWSSAEVARSGTAHPVTTGPEAAANELERVLERAVGRQMVSDVPLGAFLSGGVDSSTIVAIMQKLSSRPVKTFTVGFAEKAFDEAEHAKSVAQHLGTEHSEIYVSPEEAMEVIPRLPSMYDEPFADPSQVPTHLIAKLARSEVTVALSGDGGDELFGGYDRHLFASGLWTKVARVPAPVRAAASQMLMRLSAGNWTRLGDAAAAVLPRSMRMRRLGEKVHKVAPMLSASSLDYLYEGVIAVWPADAQPVAGVRYRSPAPPSLGALTGAARMMARDMLGYLPDDILVKVDRAAMAVSLETRVPLLDPEVVEFAWRLPMNLKIRGGKTKWLLRQVLYRHVPASLIERPKTGFSVPIGDWLRGPLRDWAEALLDVRRLRDEGFFDPNTIRTAWAEHLKGGGHGSRLWGVLMFQAWQDEQARIATPEPQAAAAGR